MHVLEYNEKQKAHHIHLFEERNKYPKSVNDEWEIIARGTEDDCFNAMHERGA